MSTLADLDGTDDAASWLHSGHVLDQQEVDFLRGLQVPDTYRTTSGRPAPHYGPVHVGRPARFSEHLRVGDWILDPAGRPVEIHALFSTGTDGETLLNTSGAIPQFTVMDGEEWALARVETQDLRPGMTVGGSVNPMTIRAIAATQWEDGPDKPPTEYAVAHGERGKLTTYSAADTQWLIYEETA